MHDIHFKNVVQHFLWPTNILARSKITPPWYMTKSLAGIVDLCWTKSSHGARSRFDVADCLILMHYCSIGLQSSLLVRDWNSVSRLFFCVDLWSERVHPSSSYRHYKWDQLLFEALSAFILPFRIQCIRETPSVWRVWRQTCQTLPDWLGYFATPKLRFISFSGFR